ncbi:CRISPR-associated protein Cas4 [Pseudoclostridium thermosuccinogenes]|uniref:CRISPR-associated protein Cas4 n=1 Tax=Clostridium thermosuccinogenes TaxID=84032 RepID=UPI002FDB5026
MDLFGNSVKITGVEINYLYVCPRKLWFFTHGISMEQNSVRVEIGKETHDNSLNRKRTEILIDNTIRLDYVDKELAVHEIKLTKAMDMASKYQLLYYLYYLNKKGIDCKKGVIHYPKTRKIETIEITQSDKEELEKAIEEIVRIKKLERPPKMIKERKCKSCSYLELCFC